MLYISKGINEKNESSADKVRANKNTPIPIVIPKMKNNIFMTISHIKPSKSQVKIKPGNLIDQEATSIKTSLTNDEVKIQ